MNLLRDEILLELRKNADESGAVEFKFSDDVVTKKQEQDALKSLKMMVTSSD